MCTPITARRVARVVRFPRVVVVVAKVGMGGDRVVVVEGPGPGVARGQEHVDRDPANPADIGAVGLEPGRHAAVRSAA